MAAAAWRVVVKRTLADWLILSAAFVTILLATTLLSAGPIYAGAVTLSGVHRTLHDAAVRDADVQISARTKGDSYSTLDGAVTAAANDAFRATGGPLYRGGRSESFALPGQDPKNVTNLTVFSFFERLDEHAALVAGNWPTAANASGDGVIEAALPETTANLLGYKLGDTLALQSRREADLIVNAHIVGLYRVNDPSDPYWWTDPLDTNGVEQGQSFTTYGPFVVAPEVFLGRLSTSSSLVYWRVYPIFDNLSVAEVPGFRSKIENLAGRLNFQRGSNDQFTVDTSLDDILRTAERSLLVTRSGVLVLTVQLAILAGYALVLTAGLLIEQRRVETALLRSRGADSGQIAAMALMEALLLTAPAIVLGPWVAATALRLLNHVGPLAAIDLSLAPKVGRDAYGLALVSGLACAVALTVPAFQSARTYAQARTGRGRQAARGVAQRAGIDLMLLVLAGLAYWQLRRYGAPITQTVQGRLGLDPFLIAAPAIGLLAGAIVALRIVPLLAQLVERLARRRRGLVSALGAWQLARRPMRYARSALLLMLALAIGLFAVAYTRTWTRSQQDQANYQVGADLRVSPDRRYGSSIPMLDVANAQLQAPGITHTMPVYEDTISVSRSAGGGEVLGLDAKQAADIVAFRGDLARAPFGDLMNTLAANRPALAAFPLPGQPQRLALDVQMQLDPLPADAQPPPDFQPSIHPSLTLVVQDATGMLYQLSTSNFADDGSQSRLILPLGYDLQNGKVAAPQYPLQIVALNLQVIPTSQYARTGRFTLQTLSVSPALSGEDWTPVSLRDSPQGWTTQNATIPSAFIAPEMRGVQVGDSPALTIDFNAGATQRDSILPATFETTPGTSAPPTAVQAVVTDAFLASTEAQVGDTIPVELGRDRHDVHIVAAVKGFPTLDPNHQNLVIVDLPTLATAEFLTSGTVTDLDEWWLATAPGSSSESAAALLAAPYSSPHVLDRVARGRTLRTDPVALGIIGALSLGFVAAALFAAIGFAVSAAVSSRERLTEFALLRALGLSPGQLSGWLSLENGLLVALSLLGGTGLGLLLAWLVLPLVSLTQAATAVVPSVHVLIPWGTVAILEGGLLLALVLVVGALAWALRRVGLGSVLRLGEER